MEAHSCIPLPGQNTSERKKISDLSFVFQNTYRLCWTFLGLYFSVPGKLQKRVKVTFCLKTYLLKVQAILANFDNPANMVAYESGSYTQNMVSYFRYLPGVPSEL